MLEKDRSLTVLQPLLLVESEFFFQTLLYSNNQLGVFLDSGQARFRLPYRSYRHTRSK